MAYLTFVIFNCLLLKQQAAQHVDRAVQNVGVKLRKAKSTRFGAERTYTFDR
jgi:hypothetical protein